MGSIAKLVSAVIGLAFTLHSVGLLPAATGWLIRQMPDGPPQMISVVKINRMLMGDPGHRPKTDRRAGTRNHD